MRERKKRKKRKGNKRQRRKKRGKERVGDNGGEGEGIRKKINQITILLLVTKIYR